MLLGNETLVNGIALFQNNFPVKFMQLAAGVAPESPFIQQGSRFLTEVLTCLQVTQTHAGRRRSFVGAPNENVEATNFFYAYLMLERFMLESCATQYPKEQQAFIRSLELEFKQTLLPFFLEIAKVMQEHYQMVRGIFDYSKRRSGSIGAAAALRRLSFSSKTGISDALHEQLASWKINFTTFKVSSVKEYAAQYLARGEIPADAYFPSPETKLPVLYRKGVTAANAKQTIESLLQSATDNIAEVYYALGNVMDLFVTQSIATKDDPPGQVDSLNCLHLLVSFYFDMLGSMLFINTGVYAGLLSDQVQINVRVDGEGKLVASSSSRHASASTTLLMPMRAAPPLPPGATAAAVGGPPPTPAPYSTTACPNCQQLYAGDRRKLQCLKCKKGTCSGCQSSHACASVHA